MKYRISEEKLNELMKDLSLKIQQLEEMRIDLINAGINKDFIETAISDLEEQYYLLEDILSEGELE